MRKNGWWIFLKQGKWSKIEPRINLIRLSKMLGIEGPLGLPSVHEMTLNWANTNEITYGCSHWGNFQYKYILIKSNASYLWVWPLCESLKPPLPFACQIIVLGAQQWLSSIEIPSKGPLNSNFQVSRHGIQIENKEVQLIRWIHL